MCAQILMIKSQGKYIGEYMGALILMIKSQGNCIGEYMCA